MALANVFNRRYLANFIGKRYAGLIYRGRQFVESGEANEMQDIIFERQQSIGDSAFSPISIREGGTIVIDQANGIVRLGESTIWAGGYMHKVPAATLTGVPMVGSVAIGISVTRAEIDEVQDVQLKGIVSNSASQGQPLAARFRYDAVWARSGDPFYPIHTIVDGIIPNERPAPSNDLSELLVERHIREDHGSHIASGFEVNWGGFDNAAKTQTFIIGAGVLRAEGRRVQRSVDQRYVRAEDPQLVQVNGETALYPVGGVVPTINGPIADVGVVTVIKEVVRTFTHQLANGTDQLPDTPVYAVVAVNAGGTWNPGTRTFTGGTNYAETTSWVRAGDGISWAPNGAEPSPGSTVTAVYRYVATVTPQAVGRQNMTLEDAVVGQPVTMSYRYKLPRIDIIAINVDGEVVYLIGTATKFNPTPPPVPASFAPLARVSNLWGIAPVIQDVDQRAMTEADVRALLRTVLNMYDLLSVQMLERDVQERDPSSRRGSFVDNFDSDNQRDLGIAQTAAVAGGFLMLPITGYPRTVDIGREAIMLPFVKEAVISQPFRTLSRKINAYANFNPLPTPVTLNPAVDRWNETQSSSSSSSTSSFRQEFSYRPDLLGTPAYGTTSFSTSSSSVTSVSSSTQDLPFLRQIQIEFTVRRMGPGEGVGSVTFDGIDVTASVVGSPKADSTGTLVGKFTIPPNVRAGTKAVRVRGDGPSLGETSFVGQGTLTVNHYHTSTFTQTVAVTIDPVAQSFVLDETRQITGARVEFTARGDAAKPIVLELRNMEGGLPGSEIYAEGVTPGTFTIGDPLVDKPANMTEINFRFPTTVPATDWRWICLLTDDVNHSVAAAQLGDQSDPTSPRGYDARRKEWVRRNPAVGDLADGSNGVSWRLLPDQDLTHEIMAARYTALSRTVRLGSFKLSDIAAGGISDVIVLLLIEAPVAATRVRLVMTRATGEVINFEPNVPLRLDDYLTETVTIDMVLEGTSTLSPIVQPECQIIWGRLQPTATYISEANVIDLTNGNAKLRTVAEFQTPGVSNAVVEVGKPGAWVTQNAIASRALGDGWIEREHLQTPYSDAEARVRITLSGSPKNRPAVRKLRQRATGV